MNQQEREHGSVSPAQMDTTEYPPEGQNVECPHTDDKKWCYCVGGVFRCPECRDWLGLSHAKKAILQIKVLDAWEATTDPVSQPELTNGSVSPAQMKNRNESNTELTCDHAIFNGNAQDGMRLYGCPKCGGIAVEYPPEGQNVECDIIKVLDA